MGGQKFRLVTRSDFDGLVCAVLMRELDLIDTITFVHPKDMQNRVQFETRRFQAKSSPSEWLWKAGTTSF
jgi:hypothetical protein